MNLRSISGDSHLLALAILFLFLLFWSLKIHKYSRIAQKSFEPNHFAAAIINTLSAAAAVGGASAASGASGAPRCSPVYCLLSQLAAFGSQAAALQLIFPLLAAISFTLPRATATCKLQLADVSPHFALFFIDRQRQQSRGGDAEQEQLLESSSSSELVACGNIRSTCGLCHTKWIAMGWAALLCSGCRSRQRNLDLFSRVSSLPSGVCFFSCFASTVGSIVIVY